MASPSPLMQLPCELRLMIYAYLFDAGEAEQERPPRLASDRNSAKTISIRHDAEWKPLATPSAPTRNRYHVIAHSINRRCVETTYRLANTGASFCPGLMRVNRAVYAEIAELVYGGHVFDFGSDVEAVRPFFEDLTSETRRLVTKLALYKKGPWLYDCWSDRCEWRAMCTYLRDQPSVKHLRLVIQAGRVAKGQESEVVGRRELSKNDMALLIDIRHDTLYWIADVLSLKGLRDIEVTPDFCIIPPPQTSNMRVFLAFSASIQTGVKEYLREQLQLPC
ncbi:hypothetical protein E0Z10_g1494 [Xylaria hypoxylon]|uniref:Uncharacterized protein n=1 Tax=Xylaria hypoxylon TaxID=37992 RepID=A0A4Z0Z526_9PEZI|nr:hypothetical protein E0Z10_g1494 [Xylaria hypoxylon]